MPRRAIYITHPGAQIRRSDGLVAAYVEGIVVDRWSIDEIERLLVFGPAQLTTQVMALFLRKGVQVSFLSTTGGYRGQLSSPESGNVFLRLAQYARYHDTAYRMAIAQQLIFAKLRSARQLLRRYARNHTDPSETGAVTNAANETGRALSAIHTATDANQLRGIEGAAAAAYFRAFDTMIRAPFRFERRSKHPAHNPVNALLNFGYTLLANEVAGQLEAAGFDPRIGLYHGIRYGRRSLALDVMEPFRIDAIDRLTLAIINRRMLAIEDFNESPDSTGTRMTRPALRRYLAAYETHMTQSTTAAPSVRLRIAATADALRASVMSGDPAAFMCATPQPDSPTPPSTREADSPAAFATRTTPQSDSSAPLSTPEADSPAAFATRTTPS